MKFKNKRKMGYFDMELKRKTHNKNVSLIESACALEMGSNVVIVMILIILHRKATTTKNTQKFIQK